MPTLTLTSPRGTTQTVTELGALEHYLRRGYQPQTGTVADARTAFTGQPATPAPLETPSTVAQLATALAADPTLKAAFGGAATPLAVGQNTATSQQPVTGVLTAGVSPGSAYLSQFATWTGTQQTAAITAMKGAGLTWVRVDVFLSAVYNNGGTYDFTSTDAAVLPFAQAGMNVLLMFNNYPGALPNQPNPATYAALAAATAARYAPQGVHSYEVGNEYNYNNQLLAATGAERTALYAAILKAVYPAIKAADPQAFVLTSGLANPASANGADGPGSALSPLSFVTGLYANGAGGYFDAIAMHPYSLPNMPLSDVQQWNQFNHLDQIRAVMVRNGDAGKQIWLTEFGFVYGPNSVYNRARYFMDAGSQLLSIRQVLEQYRRWPWLGGPLFVYNWVDTTQGAFGLAVPVRDGTPTAPVDVFAAKLSGTLTNGATITGIPVKPTSYVLTLPTGTTIKLGTQSTTLTAPWIASLTDVTTMQIGSLTLTAGFADDANVVASWATPAAGTPADYTVASLRPVASALPSLLAAPPARQDGFGYPHTVDPGLVRGSDFLPLPAANNAVYLRCRDGGTITGVGFWVGVSSGTISLAAYSNVGVGRAARPGTRLATTGSVGCPGGGYRELFFPAAVTLQPGDWLAISADNITATFHTLLTAQVANDIALGRQFLQVVHPLPAAPSALTATVGNSFVLVGV